MRLWGKGEVLEYGTRKFEGFVEENKVDAIAGTRAIVVVHIHQVGSSCGFSVPFYDFKAFRPTLNEFFEKRVASEMAGNRKDGIERWVLTPFEYISNMLTLVADTGRSRILRAWMDYQV